MDFDQIYEQYADTVYSYLRFRLSDRHLAEDVFQETFMTIYANLDKWKTVQSPKAWILTIAHRKMVDRIRKQSVEAAPLDMDEGALKLSEPSSEHQLVIQLDLERSLQQLDETSRQILYGIYVEKLTCKEMAEILQVPEGTVKSRCHYARNKLKEWHRKGVARYD